MTEKEFADRSFEFKTKGYLTIGKVQFGRKDLMGAFEVNPYISEKHLENYIEKDYRVIAKRNDKKNWMEQRVVFRDYNTGGLFIVTSHPDKHRGRLNTSGNVTAKDSWETALDRLERPTHIIIAKIKQT
ncbi:MAG: hypothetical protein COA82_03410 [Alkaliphilus sp.]|nr:MAG: hypothetical protein COA82_03410 [Alkaliphilus sp.]